MPTTKPNARFYWTQGLAGQVATPDDTLRKTGWTAGQPIAAQHVNDVLYELGNWVAWLDENQGATVLAATLDSSIRLLGGGTLNYAAATSTLSWSAPWVLSVPSIADADNTIPAGGAAIASGRLAYVNANIPFTTTGDVASGSTTVANLAYDLPIVTGQSVTGTGVAAGTTVAAANGTSLTLSQPATATTPQTALTFCGTGALSVQTAPVASFVPSANSVVLAIGQGSHVFVGVNAAVAVVHDGESRTLMDPGYIGIVRLPAGQALSAGQMVYQSTNTTGTRTLGALYPADCSATNGASRSLCLGLAHSAAASGAMCSVVTGGTVPLSGGFAPGVALYLDPANPGGVTQTQPSIATTPYCVRVGVALSASSISLRPEHVGDGIFPSVKAQTAGLGALTLQASAGGVPLTVNSSAQALLGTLSDAGALSLPSFVSGSGFKTVIPMGGMYVNASSPTAYSGLLTTMSQYNAGQTVTAIPCVWVATHPGSVVGISGYLNSAITPDPNFDLSVYFRALLNGATATAARFIGAGGTGNYVAFKKGVYTFAAGQQVLMQVMFPANNVTNTFTGHIAVELGA